MNVVLAVTADEVRETLLAAIPYVLGGAAAIVGIVILALLIGGAVREAIREPFLLLFLVGGFIVIGFVAFLFGAAPGTAAIVGLVGGVGLFLAFVFASWF